MTTFCLSEDREFDEIGVRMAVCSLRRHCPDASVVVYRKCPRPSFADWLAGFPNVTFIPASPDGATSWNCKPHALLPILRSGAEEVVWLDADVVLAGDLRDTFRGWSSETFGVCEEYGTAPHQGSRLRTEGWGLAVGREFPRTLNSAVLRATPAHIPLLQRWQGLLEDPRYTSWQTRPLNERPLHAWGDQDVLNALLGSVEFAALPVRLLRTGRDLVHCGSATSYPVGERIDGLLRRIPPVIHTQGAKPWVVFHAPLAASPPGLSGKFFRLVQQLSLYRATARRYRDEVGVPCDWVDRWSVGGRILRALGLGHHALQGLPLAAAASVGKWFAPRLTTFSSVRERLRRVSAAFPDSSATEDEVVSRHHPDSNSQDHG